VPIVCEVSGESDVTPERDALGGRIASAGLARLGVSDMRRLSRLLAASIPVVDQQDASVISGRQCGYEATARRPAARFAPKTPPCC
jgi:hypothetical protein